MHRDGVSELNQMWARERERDRSMSRTLLWFFVTLTSLLALVCAMELALGDTEEAGTQSVIYTEPNDGFAKNTHGREFVRLMNGTLAQPWDYYTGGIRYLMCAFSPTNGSSWFSVEVAHDGEDGNGDGDIYAQWDVVATSNGSIAIVARTFQWWATYSEITAFIHFNNTPLSSWYILQVWSDTSAPNSIVASAINENDVAMVVFFTNNNYLRSIKINLSADPPTVGSSNSISSGGQPLSYGPFVALCDDNDTFFIMSGWSVGGTYRLIIWSEGFTQLDWLASFDPSYWHPTDLAILKDGRWIFTAAYGTAGTSSIRLYIQKHPFLFGGLSAWYLKYPDNATGTMAWPLIGLRGDVDTFYLFGYSASDDKFYRYEGAWYFSNESIQATKTNIFSQSETSLTGVSWSTSKDRYPRLTHPVTGLDVYTQLPNGASFNFLDPDTGNYQGRHYQSTGLIWPYIPWGPVPGVVTNLNDTMPDGYALMDYIMLFNASGGSGNYTWSVVNGSVGVFSGPYYLLPGGLPEGEYSVWVYVEDEASYYDLDLFTLTIGEGAGGGDEEDDAWTSPSIISPATWGYLVWVILGLLVLGVVLIWGNNPG